MNKLTLLSATALRSAVFVTVAAAGLVAPAAAQTANAVSTTPGVPADQCKPASPSNDPNTGNCVQPAEGSKATAPGTNAGTTPSDETPTAGLAGNNDQEITVTGSRIPRPAFEGTIPGAQVTQEQISTRAFTNALDALNDIPLVGPGASPFGTNGNQPGSLGSSFVDLLDLGTNRTLTLVNGRRFVSGNQGTLFVSGNTTGSQVDLSVIPGALISRLDVLTVGGAAAYGSDAISGVVNAILIDDYDGFQLGGVVGVSQKGDAFNYRVNGIAGRNFLGKRANVTVTFEHVRDDALTGDRRNEILLNPVAPTFFGNGGQRNRAFVPVFGATQNGGNGAFLPAFADQTPTNIAGTTGNFGGTIVVSPGGTVFADPGLITGLTQGPYTTVPGSTIATGTPTVRASIATNAQLIPGTPQAAVLAGCSVINLTNFCAFAPTGLPAGTAAQLAAFTNTVIARYAPSIGATGTTAERNGLAVQLLQANLPTPREYFAANPGTNTNLFLARFVNLQQATTTPGFLTIANTNAATLGAFPRIAVPLYFDNAGNLQNESLCVTPSSPATTGGAPCSKEFQNPSQFNILRTAQTRNVANLFAHFDLTDNLTVYTENLYARVKTVSPQNTIGSANTIGSTTAENGALLLSINNPFLSAANRAILVGAGVNATTGTFLLSRTNQDLTPNGVLPITNISDTYRVVGGIKGKFDLLGQNHKFDASVTFGRNDARYSRLGILDAEYALAIDAVRDPVSGNIVCRAQIDRAGALGTRGLPRGVSAADIIRVRQPDGSFKETVVIRTATDQQISSCQPLNPFGFGQSSEAARNYVTAQTQFKNRNDQLFFQSSLAGSLFRLPGGPLGYALSADYRKDKIDFQVDPDVSALGRTRSAVLTRTQGEVKNIELGAEVRIPIFGDDFHIPLFRNLEINPAIRFVKQTGDAPDVTLLNGTRLDNHANSGWNKIYSLAGSWRPIKDILFRGNITKSLRQPSVVELFLGGQPAFNAYTDPCSNGSIGGGLTPAIRQANCQAAVIAAGYAANATDAQTFLAAFSNPGASITGSFSGAPGLKPERGNSYTFGVALNPSFISGMRLSADYIDVKLRNRIIPTTLTTALQVCYDDPNFPNTTASVGVNTCTFFNRATAADPSLPQFQPQNGFNSGFINLGALEVNAINATFNYDVPTRDLIGSGFGNIELYANVYHLIHYRTSSNGNLRDPNFVNDLKGDASHPAWEVQAHIRYEHPSGVFAQWTTNWQNRTCAIGSAGVCATNEEYDLLRIPAYAVHDATLGYAFGEKRRFSIQLAVGNVLDKRYVVPFPQANALAIGGVVDTIGRRYRLSTNVRF